MQLDDTVALPCGLLLANRLVKAPLEELFASFGGGTPTLAHQELYATWAKGNWGMVITGNVMVSPEHIGLPFDVIIPSLNCTASTDAFCAWAKASHSVPRRPIVVMQLNHPGRQSMRCSNRSVFKPSLSPSAVPLEASGRSGAGKALARLVWGTPKQMSEQEIDRLVDEFVRGARLAKETGFDGVELHASHGYLLAQFLSPNVNLRTDQYGGSNRNRLRLITRIVDAIRKHLPMSSGFCLGIKLNSADYVSGGLTEEDALENTRMLAEHGGLDFIEVSGGNYENPQFMREDLGSSTPSHSKSSKQGLPPREAFFHNFSTSAQALLSSLALPHPPPLLMLTGGFRTRAGMQSALSSASTSLIGIGRPACAEPLLPLKLLDSSLSDEEASVERYTVPGAWLLRRSPIGLILPGLSTLFHSMMMRQIARGEKPNTRMGFAAGVWSVWLWPAVRVLWLQWWWACVLVFICAVIWRT